MRAMVLTRLGEIGAGARPPLIAADLPRPVPQDDELLVRVTACGVCRTEVDEIEGRTPPPDLPRVPGHQIVGRVETVGVSANGGFRRGDRVGVAWIHHACGHCRFCRSHRENLCPEFQATGRDRDGGYAEFVTVPAAFAHRIPAVFSDVEAAPLLCAGAVGYRALAHARLDDGAPLGLMGFGASAHLVLSLARHRCPRSPIFAFARSEAERDFARERGAVWAGDIADTPPEPLAAIIDTTPAWWPVVCALKHLEPGGRLIINAIGKEDADQSALLGLDYQENLWLEKEVKTVANVTRRDVAEFLDAAAAIPLKPEVQVYGLEQANDALVDLKERRIRGAKVLRL